MTLCGWKLKSHRLEFLSFKIGLYSSGVLDESFPTKSVESRSVPVGFHWEFNTLRRIPTSDPIDSCWFHRSDWMTWEFLKNLNRSQHSRMSLVLSLFQTYFKLYLELIIYYFLENFKRYLLIKRKASITSKDWEKSWKYWEIHYAEETCCMGIDACRFYVVFFLRWKKPTNDDQKNTLFSFLLSNIYYASKNCCSTMLCAVTSTFGEREQKQARQSTFFLLSVADSFSKSYILYCNKFEKNAQIYAKVHEKVVKWLVIQTSIRLNIYEQSIPN